ncbi:ATP-binding cassette domain-containing protein [Methanomassiliicoccaceae archaeon DOK]|nr:ATP-binding cassette domain-containing protein [Methanomassiliicoccaceae archaeon DOK]
MRVSVMRRFALSEDGYRYLCRSSLACILKDLALMFPVMVLFMFVCDIMGGPGNPYDLDLGAWAYIAMIVVSAALIAVTYVFEYNETYFNTYKESSAKRIALAEKLRRLPMSYFGRKDPTDLTVRIMGDCTMQEQSMSHWFPELIGSMICISMLGIMILAFDPVMGAASLWPIPVSFAIVILSKRFQDKYNRYKFDRTLEATEGVQEFLETSRDLRVNDAGRRYLDGLFGKLDRVEGAEFKAEYMVAIFVVSAQLVLKFGIVTTALAGGYMMVSGSLDIFVFIAFLIVISRLYDPLNNALQNLAAMINAEYNMERLQEIADQPVQGGSSEFRPDGYDIVFDHVRFSYDGERDVLRDVSFTARQGEVTAIIGPSGEGKTTAAKLAARFWDLDSGRITVGGVDISGIDPETLLSCYSIVFQDVTLFNTTVMDNIRIGRRGATDEEVMVAARAAKCDDFVSRMPEGYMTVIGENGAKLSGGERQRISIARALLKDAPIILLDEATASLDTECETQVQQAISELVRDKTVLIVAHRMRTIEGADRIVVLRDGTVEEDGSPDQLMAEGGTFSNMVRLQSSSEGWTL